MTSVTTSHCHYSSKHSPLEVTSRSIIIYNQFWPFLQHSIYRFFYMLLAQPSSPSRCVDHNRPPKSTSINLKSLPNTVIQPLMEGSLLKVVATRSHEHVHTHRRNHNQEKIPFTIAFVFKCYNYHHHHHIQKKRKYTHTPEPHQNAPTWQ